MPRIAVIEDTLEFLAPVRDVSRRMVRDIRTVRDRKQVLALLLFVVQGCVADRSAARQSASVERLAAAVQPAAPAIEDKGAGLAVATLPAMIRADRRRRTPALGAASRARRH